MPDDTNRSQATDGSPLEEERRELERHLALVEQAIASGHRDAALAQLRALAGSLEVHFREEERWMTAQAYPDLLAHTRAHAAGLESLRQAIAEFDRTGAAARFLVERAASWLDLHLRREDQRLERFLEERRAPALPRGS